MASPSEIEKLKRRWSENPLGLTFAPYAEACRKAGDLSTALQVLADGLTQHPDYVPAHIVHGRCHLDAHADAEAEGVFQRVLELDPENVIALRSLAELAERAGRLPEAIQRLKQILELDRNNEDARGQLDRVMELQSAPPAPTRMVEMPEGLLPNLVEDEGLDVQPSEASPIPGTALDDPNALPALGSAEVESFADAPLMDLAPLEEDASPIESRGEFEVSNDSEALRPAQRPMDDIVLGAEPPDFEYHETPVATEPVPAPAGMDPLPAAAEPTSFEGPPSLIEEEVFEPVVDILPPPPPEMVEETVLPPPPPPPVPEPPPVAVQVADREPVSGHVEEESPHAPVALPEPELVVTESMAEVFLRQGYRELARAVYSQLAERDPADAKVAAALAALQAELAPPPPPPPAAAPAEPKQRFDAEATGGRSVRQLFSGLLAATRPAVSATVHPPAFEAPRRPAGEPTRAAQESLSLSAVFGEEASPAATSAGAPQSESNEPSFDEFYAPQSAGGEGSEVAAPPATEKPGAAADPAQSDEDLEQFNAWLRGLKR